VNLKTCLHIAFAFLAVAALSLSAAPRAHAHAVLLGTEPTLQALVADPPHEVELTFSEQVSLKLGGVEVFGPAGGLVSSGPAVAAGNRVSVPISSEAPGTYAVSWRVISADGHPIRGAFVFSAGRRSESTAVKKAFAAAKTDRGLSIAFGVARFGYLAAILIAAGAAIFSAVVAPRWSPRLIGPALGAVIGWSVVGFFLQTAIAADISLWDAFNRDVLEDELSTLYGNAAVVRVTLAVLGLALLRLIRPLGETDRVARVALAGVLVAMAAGQSLSGHAMAASPTAIRLPLDMLHVVAAAAWFGGLVQLYRYVSRDPVDPAAVVRFSKLALTCVITLVATGTYATLVESDVSLSALVDTTYGRILAIKLGLFALTMPIANVNRTRNVPAIVAGATNAPAMLGRYVRMEMAVLTAVVIFTAVLIETVPARHAQHKLKAPAGPIAETRTLPSGARATLTIDAGTAGPNTITVGVRTRAGRPDTGVDEITLTGSIAKRKIAALPLALKRVGPGRWRGAGRVLPLPGRWRFEIAIRRGEFDEERAKVDADIR
jgi:copper transport protein